MKVSTCCRITIVGTNTEMSGDNMEVDDLVEDGDSDHDDMGEDSVVI